MGLPRPLPLDLALAATDPVVVADVADAGANRVTFGPADDPGWFVERISVTSTSTSRVRCDVYIGGEAPQNLVDTTNRGNRAISDQLAPLFVPAGFELLLVWVGGGPGDVVTARVQYRPAVRP
jgi:hypothetical protein